MLRVYNSGQAASSSWIGLNILIHLIVVQSILIITIQADELSEGSQDLHDPKIYSQQKAVLQAAAQRQIDPKRSIPIPISTNITRTTTKKPLPYPLKYFWKKNEYPNPLKEPYSCKQPQKSLLCDPDQLLNDKEALEIRNLLDRSKQSQKCFCLKCPAGENGLKIGVALAGSIQSDNNDASQEFADELHRKWNYALCNDSILLLLIGSYTTQQSSLVTSMGNVAEKVFPAEFFRNLIPKQALSSENYGKFLQSILLAIIDYQESIEDPARFIRLNEETPIAKVSNDDAITSNTTSTTSLMVISIIIGFIVFIAFLMGAMVLLKRRFSTEPDPELPTNDGNDSYMKSPPGYESVSQQDTEDSNNNMRHENENENEDENETDNQNQNESRAPEPPSPSLIPAEDDTVLNEDFNIGGDESSQSAGINNNNIQPIHLKDTPV